MRSVPADMQLAVFVASRQAHESLELVGKLTTTAAGASLERKGWNTQSVGSSLIIISTTERGEPAPKTQPTCPIVVALQQRHQPPTGPDLPV